MERTESSNDRTAADTSRRRRTVTIKDVARASGVSAATVTRALQGHPRVLAATRTRVETAARKLGYRPDHVARTLVTGTSRTIGLLIPTIADPYWAEVAEGIEQRAAEKGFSVLFASGHGDARRAEQMLDVFLGKRVDGVIVTTSAGAELRLDEVGAQPVVVVGWDPPVAPAELERAWTAPTEVLLDEASRRAGPPVAYIAFDDVGAGRVAAGHLVELGHRAIAFLGGPPTLAAVLRLLGGRLVLEQEGLAFEQVLVGADTLEDGRTAALRLLQGEPRPTAVVAFNDLVAVGALRAAHALGIDVPGELSVVGFDDITLAAFAEPALTTVRQPKGEMGARAMDLLDAAMQGVAQAGGDHLSGVLVERESTARAPLA